jgi:hypothetical protein
MQLEQALAQVANKHKGSNKPVVQVVNRLAAEQHKAANNKPVVVAAASWQD